MKEGTFRCLNQLMIFYRQPQPPCSILTAPPVSFKMWEASAVLRFEPNHLFKVTTVTVFWNGNCILVKDKNKNKAFTNLTCHNTLRGSVVFTDVHCMSFLPPLSFTAVIKKSHFIKDLAAAEQIG